MSSNDIRRVGTGGYYFLIFVKASDFVKGYRHLKEKFIGGDICLDITKFTYMNTF